jgi:hypothetical protein
VRWGTGQPAYTAPEGPALPSREGAADAGAFACALRSSHEPAYLDDGGPDLFGVADGQELDHEPVQGGRKDGQGGIVVDVVFHQGAYLGVAPGFEKQVTRVWSTPAPAQRRGK